MNVLDPRAWIGRIEESRDQISHNLVRRIAATLGDTCPQPGDALPPLWHWAFFQDPMPEDGLGSDGHPARGSFLPPAEGRNRMWAGSRLSFRKPLRVGAEVDRLSSIVNVEEKHGRTGSLLFVTVRHEFFQEGECRLVDEQDIVYREPTPPKLGGTETLPAAQWREAVTPTATLLFRYSAVTFNGHRIHYDWPYVTETEGYPGLVVHGPLIATLSLRAFLRANPAATLKSFSFRGVRPLIAPTPFEVGGCIVEPGRARVWASNGDGSAQLGEIVFTGASA